VTSPHDTRGERRRQGRRARGPRRRGRSGGREAVEEAIVERSLPAVNPAIEHDVTTGEISEEIAHVVKAIPRVGCSRTSRTEVLEGNQAQKVVVR
jgi:hypothetical protein